MTDNEERTCQGPCGLPGGAYEHTDSQPWGLDGWCDTCWTRQRQASWNAWNRAVRDGRFSSPGTCSDPRCGRSDRKLQAHHLNYLEPYNIVWLCASNCHARAHKEAEKAHRENLTLNPRLGSILSNGEGHLAGKWLNLLTDQAGGEGLRGSDKPNRGNR